MNLTLWAIATLISPRVVRYLVSLFLTLISLTLLRLQNVRTVTRQWSLLPGYKRPDGNIGKCMYPLAAMVTNLAKPTPDRPALMHHDDVVMFFHEMGHIFHGLLSRTQLSHFHGTSVARDFVEVPSRTRCCKYSWLLGGTSILST